MDTQSDRKQGGRRGLKKIGGAAVLAALLCFSQPQEAAADMTLLKMGWTYNIGFPETLNDGPGPRLGLSAGMNPYRVLESGGQGWYRLQRVVRHPNGGWYSPKGTPRVWVNMGYAYAILEQP